MTDLPDACANVPAGVFSCCFAVPSCSHVHMFACLFGSELGRRPLVYLSFECYHVGYTVPVARVTSLRMCYCVTKLHRCFHYDVDSDFVLHSNCRCSENVDVATDKFWPVVTMCRRCSPFAEGQNDGNSPAH